LFLYLFISLLFIIHVIYIIFHYFLKNLFVLQQEAEGATGDGPPGDVEGDVDDEEGFEYDEELYEQLLGMGFDEEDVLQALKVAPFDKSAALDYLYAYVTLPRTCTCNWWAL
jgi:hypothetical protein